MMQLHTNAVELSRAARVLVGVAAFWAVGLQGAVAAAPASTDANEGGLEEIVVTALRRETNLSNTPISLSALSATEIERNRVVRMEDVERMVPSLVFMPQSASETYLSIRGTSTIDDSTGTDQGVNMFFDDVVRTGIADLQPDLYDMERVEVLKGPQGTLFGRNSLGGTLSLYSKDPVFRNEGSAEASYGQNNLIEAKGMFNTGLIDNVLAVRFVIAAHSNGGYISDPVTNTDIGKESRWSGRAKLLYTPSESLRVVAGLDYLTSRGDAPAWINLNFVPALEPPMVNDPNRTSQADPGKRNQDIWGLNVRADWTQPLGTLTSISAYRHLNVLDRSSETGDPLNTLTLQTVEHDRQFSEEMRFASPSDQRLSWVAGLYYLHLDKGRPINGVLNFPGGAFCPAGSAPSDCPGTGAVAFFRNNGVGGVADYIADQDTLTTSYAGFIDANLAITDQFKIDVGARYTYEKKVGFANLNHSNHFFGPPISGDFDHSWTNATPKVTLTYKPVESLMAYVTVSKGFQSGGFNTQGGDASSLTLPFGSEIVWNYEAGLKFDGLQHRLQLNASVFTDRYSQLQIIQNVTSPAGFFTATNNAGAATVNGLESDMQVAPLNWFTVGLRYDYLTSKFTKYVIDNGDGTFTNYNGNEVPFIARNRFTLSLDAHDDLAADRGRIAMGGDVSYRTKYYITPANAGDTPGDITNRTAWHGLLNLHASWTSTDGHHEVALFGQNVTNIHYAFLPADLSVFVQTLAEAQGGTDKLYHLRAGPYQSIGITFREKF